MHAKIFPLKIYVTVCRIPGDALLTKHVRSKKHGSVLERRFKKKKETNEKEEQPCLQRRHMAGRFSEYWI